MARALRGETGIVDNRVPQCNFPWLYQYIAHIRSCQRVSGRFDYETMKDVNKDEQAQKNCHNRTPDGQEYMSTCTAHNRQIAASLI